jgi:hypothetical protein
MMLSTLKCLLSRFLLGSADRAARLALDANARLAMPPRALKAELCLPSTSSEDEVTAARSSLVIIEGGRSRASRPDVPPAVPTRSGNGLRKAI